MGAYLILGLGALCMTQVNWASSPAANVAFLILFTKRGGTARNMSKYNTCLNTIQVILSTVLECSLKYLIFSVLHSNYKAFRYFRPRWHCVLLTLNSDLAKSAGSAGRARGEAHVLSRIVCCHVIQDQRAGTVRVLDDDVMRIRLHSTSIYTQQVNQCTDELVTQWLD